MKYIKTSIGYGRKNVSADNVRRINIVTMGCSKNLVDSEVLLKQLEHGSFRVEHDSGGTGFDAVIINTCGFIDEAKQESIDMILDYASAKKRGEIGRLYVMGCLSERYQKELEQEIPEVDRYFGKFDQKAIREELNVPFHPELIYERKITTPSHYAYLKISEGCNRSCSFCSIPFMTGRYKSRTIESLVKETLYLANTGVREILLVAQDLSYYGIDIYRRNKLAELIKHISGIRGIEWIRLHYLFPSKFPEEILDIIREDPKICRYIDIPLQHIANPVLHRMKRNVTREETESLIGKIRDKVPGAVIRTTFMTGFPGETDADFEELKQFVMRAKFERLGVFIYSHEDGTYAAAKYSDDIPQKIKQRRADTIMEIQKQISAEINRQKTGKTFRVIIDRKDNNYYFGRTEFDSPEVDGEVIIQGQSELQVGKFYKVKMVGSDDYDLTGEVVI